MHPTFQSDPENDEASNASTDAEDLLDDDERPRAKHGRKRGSASKTKDGTKKRRTSKGDETGIDKVSMAHALAAAKDDRSSANHHAICVMYLQSSEKSSELKRLQSYVLACGTLRR